MNANELVILEESQRLHIRHSKEPDLPSAIRSAMHDLVFAKDYAFIQPDNPPTKMEAIDFLRLVAMVLPELINDEIYLELIKQFKKCNESSQMEILMILGLTGQKESLPFIRELINGITDSNSTVSEVAKEAIDVIEGKREIGWGNKWIYGIIKRVES